MWVITNCCINKEGRKAMPLEYTSSVTTNTLICTLKEERVRAKGGETDKNNGRSTQVDKETTTLYRH